ncbi:Cof-type HAD-IIB family hydrolase [Oceanivirga miroungae]|uniref:Cof family hydrolase n=1 Tax=Oceanivirga miroungae TaxID=1130046 RepID=A0A6I8MF67_9FUSO|nr:Cof-type HAD-IIB family hydrolase [Oceanivirga miroungae]VWL85726.1 cof family hydrolase [Oceanivirga miroungae]
MYKLIATDMDGTLVNSKREISQNNIDMIIKAQKEKGVKFVLASGRVEEAMINQAKLLKLDQYGGYILSYNGSRIIECKSNEVIYNKSISRDEIKELLEISNKYDVALVTYIDGLLYYNKEHKYVDEEEKITTFTKHKYETIDDIKVSTVGKCMFIGDVDKLAKLMEYLKGIYKDKFYITLSSPYFLEILNKDVSKGRSLKKLCEILGIDIKDMIACGDSYNDSDMLEVAGLSVAAKNAVQDIKDIADYVSVTNDEGVLADVINKYVI